MFLLCRYICAYCLYICNRAYYLSACQHISSSLHFTIMQNNFFAYVMQYALSYVQNSCCICGKRIYILHKSHYKLAVRPVTLHIELVPYDRFIHRKCTIQRSKSTEFLCGCIVKAFVQRTTINLTHIWSSLNAAHRYRYVLASQQ